MEAGLFPCHDRAMSFDIDRFVAACRAARDEPDAPERIAALVREAIADPAAISRAIAQRRNGEREGEMAELFANAPDLTTYQVSLPSRLFGVPHDHAGWAVIGVYAGAEAFTIYEERDGKLEPVGRRVMEAGSVDVLPPELIHDINNPGEAASGALHVYANGHFDWLGRRIWRDGADTAEPFTMARAFEYGMERNARRRHELGLGAVEAPLMPDTSRLRC